MFFKGKEKIILPSNNRVEKFFSVLFVSVQKFTRRTNTLSFVFVAQHTGYLPGANLMIPQIFCENLINGGFKNIWNHFTNFSNRQTPIFAHKRFDTCSGRLVWNKWTPPAGSSWTFVWPAENSLYHFLSFLTYGMTSNVDKVWAVCKDQSPMNFTGWRTFKVQKSNDWSYSVLGESGNHPLRREWLLCQDWAS